jgi:hypothetical protein
MYVESLPRSLFSFVLYFFNDDTILHCAVHSIFVSLHYYGALSCTVSTYQPRPPEIQDGYQGIGCLLFPT